MQGEPVIERFSQSSRGKKINYWPAWRERKTCPWAYKYKGALLFILGDNLIGCDL
jgi:hypothetical protein